LRGSTLSAYPLVFVPDHLLPSATFTVPCMPMGTLLLFFSKPATLNPVS